MDDEDTLSSLNQVVVVEEVVVVVVVVGEFSMSEFRPCCQKDTQGQDSKMWMRCLKCSRIPI